MMTRIIVIMMVTLASLAVARAARAAGPNQAAPADLIQLERQVSLKMAHARDEGYTDAARRKTLADAEKVDAEAEKSLKDGEYERAENDLLQAKVLLHNLGL